MANGSPWHRWYTSARWQRLRVAHLSARPLCAMHLARGQTVAGNTVDHVEPHRGDPVSFWSGTLQTLCSTCHSAAKQAEEKSGALRGCDTQGRPLDPRHHWNAAMR